jgi:very-short-patch-repair endonuclease
LIAVERGPTRSELEEMYLELVAGYGLPEPLVNEMAGGYEADVYYSAERVIVQLDGWETHQTRERFESDREHDADRVDRLGIETIRITDRQMQRRPAKAAGRVHRILDRRRRAAA